MKTEIEEVLKAARTVKAYCVREVKEGCENCIFKQEGYNWCNVAGVKPATWFVPERNWRKEKGEKDG